jgi:hypothetical protein
MYQDFIIFSAHIFWLNILNNKLFKKKNHGSHKLLEVLSWVTLFCNEMK